MGRSSRRILANSAGQFLINCIIPFTIRSALAFKLSLCDFIKYARNDKAFTCAVIKSVYISLLFGFSLKKLSIFYSLCITLSIVRPNLTSVLRLLAMQLNLLSMVLHLVCPGLASFDSFETLGLYSSDIQQVL
jgi:hypothetical protein